MQNPADFSKYNPNTRAHADYLLQKYKDVFKWTDFEEMLEVGCANGSITQGVLYPFVENYLKRLLAVDISVPAIDIANAENQNKKITFQVMNFGNQTEGDNYAGKFGKIFAFYCFHLVQPAEIWPKNVYRMLRSGGQVFGMVALSPNFNTDAMDAQLADINAPWNKYIQNRPNVLTFYGPKPVEAISKILTDAGLIVDGICFEELRNTFEVKENLIKTIRSISFFAKYVPEEMKEDYLDDYVRKTWEYIKIDDDGHHYYSMDVVSFVATKP